MALAGGRERGRPARRAGATVLTRAFGAEDEWGCSPFDGARGEPRATSRVRGQDPLPFADETTRDLFGNVNSKSARRIPNTAWKGAQRKLKQLDLVTRLDDLQIPPGNDLHALKGNEAGRHAIKVNDQYRITFRWEGQDAYDVCCEDYH